MLFLESCVEILGYLLGIHHEGSLDALLHIHNGGVFVKIEAQVGNLGVKKLCLGYAGILDGYDVALFHFVYRGNPLVVEALLLYVDADVVVGLLAQFDVYFLAGRGCRYLLYQAGKYLEAIALGYGLHLVVYVVDMGHDDIGHALGIVPSHFCDEQFLETGFLYILVEFFSCHVMFCLELL